MSNYNITKTLNLSKEKRRDFNKLLKNSGGGSSPLILVFSSENTFNIEEIHLQYFKSIGAKLIFNDTYNEEILTKEEVAKIANNNFIFIVATDSYFYTICGGNGMNGESYHLNCVTLKGEYLGTNGDSLAMYTPANYIVRYNPIDEIYQFTINMPV